MRVAVLNLTAGGLSGGYKKYLQSLAPLLRQHTGVTNLLQVVPPGHETLSGLGEHVWTWRQGEQWRGFPRLAERVREWKPDVVFVPTARSLDCGAPCVSMVRNMEPMLPVSFRDGIASMAKNRMGALLAKRASRKAARVIAVSDFVRKFLVQQWNIDAGKIGVVYHGVDQPALVDRAPEKLAAHSSTPFLFAAGSLLPYRGLEDAISALGDESLRVRSLVIAGDGSADYKARMQQLAVSLGVSERVHWLGVLNETEMNWAYTNCSAFLMTSRVEACPNTALEAIACGALCISTRSQPMPEFFTEGALYYDAGESAELSGQIKRIMSMDEFEQAALRDYCRTRSREFSWAATAKRTVDELTLALR